MPVQVRAAAGPILAQAGLGVSGTMRPSKVSGAYRAGLAVVALAMLLLPALYLALAAGVGRGVWWHLTANTWMLEGRGSQWRLLLYAAPAVAGIVLLFFMVKPILARPQRQEPPLALKPDEEPLLFAFIQEICRQVRAPEPKRVQVDCQVNASASFMPGPLAVARRDLVLTIGLPLAAGLSMRQLGGVLAHEFGHFAQGGGMRLTAVVRGINAWFARVVYERDRWDDALERWSKGGDWRVMAVLATARVAVWISRQILKGLMMAGHAISCFMLRQMEFDADRCEVKLSGSEAFARTCARLREMGLGAAVGVSELRESFLHRALPSNLPVFIVERTGRLPEAMLEDVRRGECAPTRLFDTHPSDADRIRAAAAARDPGVLVGGEAPARGLFRDFDALSAAATRHHYIRDLGIALDGIRLVETHAAIQDGIRRDARGRAFAVIFSGATSVYRPVRLDPAGAAGRGIPEAAAEMRAARERMNAAHAALRDRYAEYERLEAARTHAFAAEELLTAGFERIEGPDFGLRSGTVEEAREEQARAAAEQRALESSLDAFEADAGARLSCGVAIADALSHERNASAMSAAAAWAAIASVQPDVREMCRLAFAASLLEANQASSPKPAQLRARLQLLEAGIEKHRGRIRERLSACPCPDFLGPAGGTLAAHCGLASDSARLHPMALAETIWSLQVNLLGELCGRVLAAEAKLEAAARAG